MIVIAATAAFLVGVLVDAGPERIAVLLLYVIAIALGRIGSVLEGRR